MGNGGGKNPSYVRIVTHKVPGVKKPIKCKAGTQIIDRAWKFLKDRLPLNQNCKVGSAALRAKLRSAQYEYWHKNDDLWLATGVLPGKWSNSSSVPENVIASPSVSKALLPALHIHLSSVQTKKVRG